MKHKFLGSILINLVVIGIFSPLFNQPGYAQTPTPISPPAQTPGRGDSLTLPGNNPGATLSDFNLFPSSQTALTEETKVATLTLAELGYQDMIIEAPVGRVKLNLNLPSSWEILPGSSLTLHNSSDTGLNATVEPFELQVILNGLSIYRTVLTNLDRPHLNIPLPESWPPRRQGDLIELLFRSRGQCDWASFGILKVFSDSFFTLKYRAQTPLFDLAHYPSPIFERAFSAQTATMVLPNQPIRLQVEGALALSARLGDLTDNALVLTTTTASALDAANLPNEHLIIVGTPKNNALLSYLNDALPLPAPFQQRRFELTGVGPDLNVPGARLTYTLQLTNTEPVSASNLGLNVQLPYAVAEVSCRPGCQRVNNTLRWNLNTLPAGAAQPITLAFVYPLTATVEPANLSFELVQNQNIINVRTLPGHVDPAAEPGPAPAPSPFFFVANGRAVPETDGVIQLLPSPRQFDKAILLVTGLTDEAVYKAGRALGVTPNLIGMNGRVALVQAVVKDGSPLLEMPQSLTLADLGYEDRVIMDATRQDISYRFNLPPNWLLTPEAGVGFAFSHSALLDPTRSSITLFFNNTPIASAALDDSNATNGELNVFFPPEKAKPGRSNNLVARVELSLLNPCANADSDQGWLNLKASSELHLPHLLSETSGQFDLDFLPVPFSAHPNLSNVLFALPEQPSMAEYEGAMQIASYLGATSQGNNFQPVVMFGSPPNVDLAAFHVIAIGRPSRNAVMQAINETLPQPFVPGTDIIRPQIDQVIFRLPAELDLGYLQLLPSPWNQDRALLAFTATSDLGLSWTGQLLIDPDKNEQLRGNLALIRNLEIHTTDTRRQTTGGELATIGTAIPGTVIVGTVTPTPFPPTPTPAAQIAGNPAAPPSVDIPPRPRWFPYVMGGGLGLIVIILGAAYRQARHRTHWEV
jgi:hypothetical protein